MKRQRTWLYVPGSNLRAMEKALSLQTDIIIYDLEDAVSLSEKEKAREQVVEQLQTATPTNHAGRVVRVNGYDTPFFKEDVHAVIGAGLDGIILPKAEDPGVLQRVEGMISALEERQNLKQGSIQLIPLIETALGVQRCYDLACRAERITCFAFGSVDYTSDIQAEPTTEGWEVLFARGQLVNSSRAAGIEGPIDTVFTDIQDTEGLARETRRAKQMGFQGKMVIHPRQLAPVNEVFTPTAAEEAEALEIVTAYAEAQNRGLGAVQVRGKMIDVPVVKKAQQILDLIQKT